VPLPAVLHFSFGGTGSYPEGPNGRQRNTLRNANQHPLNTPYTRSASMQYAEQDGSNRQQFPMCGESTT
jgi:hypothetical protein